MNSISPSVVSINSLALTALQHGADAGGIPIVLIIDGKPRTVGYAMPNSVWFRRLDRSLHFWRSGGEAIGASCAALAEARRLGCTTCRVVDSESGDTYLCGIGEYELYGRPIHRPGWEPQIALSLDHWHIVRRDGTQIPPVHERQPEPEQMNLFQAVNA